MHPEMYTRKVTRRHLIPGARDQPVAWPSIRLVLKGIQMNKRLGALLVLILSAGNAWAANITSNGSGPWNSTSTWSTATIPGPGDIVTIGAGHSVHLASGGVSSPAHIVIDRLTIDGTLITDDKPSFGTDAVIEVNRLRVNSAGSLIGQNGTGNSPGGSIRVLGRTELRVTVDGSMIGGAGAWGGGIFVYGYDANWNPLPVSVWNSTGTIQAGADGGFVDIYMRDIGVLGGLIAAGDSPINCAPGSVYLYAEQLLNIGGNAIVRSGDCPNLAPRAYGAVQIISSNQLSIGTNAVVDARTNGCAWIWANSSTILGTVIAPCLNYDPPDLTLADTGRLLGKNIKIGAQKFTADGLADPLAIDATETIDFYINPGGTLDLRGLSAGSNWFRAGNSITIRADAGKVLTDAGVSIGSLMSPAPVLLPGEAMRELLLGGGADRHSAQPGTVLQLPRDILNFGSASEPVTISITDSKGWLMNPVNDSRTLAAGGLAHYVLDVVIPPGAQPGESTVVQLSVTGQTVPSFTRDASITVSVARACPADFDGSGFVDLDDFTSFVAAFELGDQSSDFDASGFTDTDDYDAFVGAFLNGC
jgi:hypothetical protein